MSESNKVDKETSQAQIQVACELSIAQQDPAAKSEKVLGQGSSLIPAPKAEAIDQGFGGADDGQDDAEQDIAESQNNTYQLCKTPWDFGKNDNRAHNRACGYCGQYVGTNLPRHNKNRHKGLQAKHLECMEDVPELKTHSQDWFSQLKKLHKCSPFNDHQAFKRATVGEHSVVTSGQEILQERILERLGKCDPPATAVSKLDALCESSGITALIETIKAHPERSETKSLAKTLTGFIEQYDTWGPKVQQVAFVLAVWTGEPLFSSILRKADDDEGLFEALEEKFTREQTVSWLRDNRSEITASTYTVCTSLFGLPAGHGAADKACLDLHLLLDFKDDQIEEMYHMAHTVQKFKHSYKAIRERVEGRDVDDTRIPWNGFVNLWNAICTPVADAVFAAHSIELAATPLTEWIKRIKDLQVTVSCMDTKTFNKVVKKFNTVFKKSLGRKLEELDPRSRPELQAPLSRKPYPNNFQMGLAYCAIEAMANDCFKKQVQIVPGGQGKSRIGAVTGFLALIDDKFEKVVFVYINQWLLERDQRDFNGLWDLTGLKDKVKYQVGLEGLQVDKSTLLVIDEVDDLIFQDPVAFHHATKDASVVGLTATWKTDEGKNNGENKLLDEFGFIEIDAMKFVPKDTIKSQGNMTISPCNIIDLRGLKTWLIQHISRRSVLIWATKKIKEELQKEAGNLPIFDGDSDPDPSVLRSLHIRVKEDLYRVVVVSDIRTMRGLDYRAPGSGITLLICNSFASQRELTQAKLRVGRQDDPCGRLIMQGVNKIDPIAEQAHLTKLFKAHKFFKELKRVQQGQILVKRATNPESIPSVTTEVESKRQKTGKQE